MRASKSLAPAQGAPDLVLRPGPVATIQRLTGWTTTELARRMGMDVSAVSRLLVGRLGLGRRSIAGLLLALRDEFGEHVCLCGLFDLVDTDGTVTHLGADLRDDTLNQDATKGGHEPGVAAS